MSDTIRLQVRPDPNTVIVTGSTLLGVENIGGAEEIYAGTVSAIAQLRTLSGGTGADVFVSGDTIVIQSSAAGDFVTTDTFTGYTATTDVRLEEIEDDIIFISGETDSNYALITGNTTDIATNAADIQLVSGETTTNYNLITGNTESINNITGDTAQLRIDVDANSGATIQNASDIQLVSGETVSNYNLITGNTAYIDAVSAITEINTSGITANEIRITDNETNIATLSGITSGNTANIAANATAITANYNSITGNTAYIDAVSGVTENNTLEIAKRVFRTGDTMTGALEVPQLNFDTGYTGNSHVVGSMHWNDFDATLDFHLKHGVVGQGFMESLVYGIAYEDLVDGDVIAIYGFDSGGTPYLGKADIPTFGKTYYTGNDVGVMTSTALSGGTCYGTVFGKVRGLDTSAWSAATTLWLSNTVRGLLTSDEPAYPDVKLPICFVSKQHATEGEIIVNPTLDISPQLNNLEYYDEYFTGTFVEKIAMTTYETGGTVYITVQADVVSGSTDFSVIWGTDEVETYSAQTIALTNGTDRIPVMNWVSMNKTAIQVHSNYFTGDALDTDGQFAAVAKVFVQSASGVTSDNVYRCHGWIDRMETTGRGDNVKVGERFRASNSEWSNGVDFTFLHTVGTPDRVDVSTTEGIIFQKNRNSFPILTTVGDVDPVWWANNETTPYEEVEHLGLINTLADGTAIGNSDWVSIVVWGCSSQNSNQCKYFANASTGDYNTEDAARQDALNYSVYTIPEDFKGSGFLIARILVRVIAEELVELGEQIDLRGLSPDSTGGGVIGGGGTILVKNSLEQDVDLIYQLVNDLTGATSTKYYGFDSGGTRGYHDFEAGSASLSGLTDTEFSGVTDLDVIVYNSGTTKWENEQPVDIFTDVDDGEYLVRSGDSIAGVVGSGGLVTGATNGLQLIDKETGLGGTLTETNTNIVGALKNISIGTSGSRIAIRNDFTELSIQDTTQIQRIRNGGDSVGGSGYYLAIDGYQGSPTYIISQSGQVNPSSGVPINAVGFNLDHSGDTFSAVDNRSVPKGLEYDDNYASGYTDRSLVDKEFAARIRIVSLTANTTLDSTYEGKMIEADGTFTITFPSGMTEGWNVSVTNVGSGTITYAAGGGATIQSKDSAVTTVSQYAGVVAYQRPTANTIIIVGELE